MKQFFKNLVWLFNNDIQSKFNPPYCIKPYKTDRQKAKEFDEQFKSLIDKGLIDKEHYNKTKALHIKYAE